MAHNNGINNNRGSNMVLYITSDVSTTGSVEVGGTLLQKFLGNRKSGNVY
jgi:hypothetical protein